MFCNVGLYIATNEFPKRGIIAKVEELKTMITNASFAVQLASSMQRLVFPRVSNDGQSSGLTKSKSFMTTESEVSKHVNIA
jgi:hypothetical protein